ncbi:hypothetical protein CGMCC3_g6598 [Colletotrichum fructicola]|nr:uncharacterized protein CGMCC3_g6598 [Colletotrichum fructicola]KAE9577344.1 hypothetical protein CGMCC3_g6598 [Colletotrichum fructicola]
MLVVGAMRNSVTEELEEVPGWAAVLEPWKGRECLLDVRMPPCPTRRPIGASWDEATSTTWPAWVEAGYRNTSGRHSQRLVVGEPCSPLQPHQPTGAQPARPVTGVTR